MAKPPVDAFVDLDVETCKRLQRFHDRLEEMNLFEVLGADPNADLATLRRAYFKRSKQFHPDRFYSRKLGPYKKVLERIFQWCSAAFKFLKDERQREDYKKRVLGLASQPNQSRRSARIVPVGQGASFEFMISEEDDETEAQQWSTRAVRTQTPDPDDALEFFIEERTPSVASQQDEPLDGLEFIIDD